MAPGKDFPVTIIGGYNPYIVGTSLSSPMVAAVVAMMHLANFRLTPDRVRDILQRTAYKDSSYSWNLSPGEGGGNFEMGYGRVDAYKAVQAVLYPPRIMISAGSLTDNAQLVITWNNDFHHIVYSNDLVPVSNGLSSWLTLDGVAPGTYDFYLKSSKGLRKLVTKTLYAQPNQNATLAFGNVIPGDANGDNKADLVDFSIWKQEYLHGCSTTPCKADFNLFSNVDLADFSVWKQAYIHPPHEGGAGDGWTGSSMPSVGSNSVQATTIAADEESQIKTIGILPTIEYNQEQITAQDANTGMSYVLYTDNISPQVGQTFNIYTYLDTNNQVASGASAVLHYDPAVLELQDSDSVSAGIQVTTGSIYPTWYGNTQTNSGWIRLGGEGTDFSGVAPFFTANFRVISSVQNTGFEITDIPGTVYENIAIQIGSENNFLQNGYYAILPVSGNPPRSEPQISFIKPVFLREDSNQICVHIQNAQDTVRTVDLTVIDSLQNSTNIPLVQQENTDWCGLWDANGTPDQTVNLNANVNFLGFVRTISSNIILDRTAPVYNSHSFTSHGNQGTDISISATDDLAGVKTIDAYYNTATDGSTQGDWVQIGELTGSSGSITWSTTSLIAGNYRIAFAFKDNADNWIWYTDENNDAFVYHKIDLVISGNAGVAGVTLNYTDGASKFATADGSGNYSFTVPSGWSGTVTPTKAGYTFTPVNKTYSNVSTNQTAQNYIAIPVITHKVKNDFDGDGKSDPAKFVPSTGVVWWLKSTTNTWDGLWLGGDTFTYAPNSDYDGDGKTDPAKFYPAAGTVWWVKSSTGTLSNADSITV